MQDLNDKQTGGSAPLVSEWNQFPSELQNIIEGTGQTLSSGDLNQLGKGFAQYAANGDFYTESGSANAYVLTPVNSKQTPIAYYDGMRVRFYAAHDSTGASTVNVAGLGVKSITSADGSAVEGGHISGFTELRYYSTSDRFDIVNSGRAIASQAEMEAGTGTYPRIMTAERVAQSIAALTNLPLPSWTSSEQIDAGTTITSALNAGICAISESEIAFADEVNQELRTYTFDGAVWTLVGSGLSISGILDAAITLLTTNTIALADGGNDTLSTYTWSGSAWSLVGSSLSLGIISSPAIAALTTSTIAYVDSNNGTLKTYSWSGSAWSQTGSTLSTGNALSNMTALNSTDVCFVNENDGYLYTYTWSGSAWSQTGNGIYQYYPFYASMSALNSTDIVYEDIDYGYIEVYRWDGTDWTNITAVTYIGNEGTLLNVTAMGGDRFAIVIGDTLYMHEHGYYIGDGPYHP